jgi:hypothetical protein
MEEKELLSIIASYYNLHPSAVSYRNGQLYIRGDSVNGMPSYYKSNITPQEFVDNLDEFEEKSNSLLGTTSGINRNSLQLLAKDYYTGDIMFKEVDREGRIISYKPLSSNSEMSFVSPITKKEYNADQNSYYKMLEDDVKFATGFDYKYDAIRKEWKLNGKRVSSPLGRPLKKAYKRSLLSPEELDKLNKELEQRYLEFYKDNVKYNQIENLTLWDEGYDLENFDESFYKKQIKDVEKKINRNKRYKKEATGQKKKRINEEIKKLETKLSELEKAKEDGISVEEYASGDESKKNEVQYSKESAIATKFFKDDLRELRSKYRVSSSGNLKIPDDLNENEYNKFIKENPINYNGTDIRKEFQEYLKDPSAKVYGSEIFDENYFTGDDFFKIPNLFNNNKQDIVTNNTNSSLEAKDRLMNLENRPLPPNESYEPITFSNELINNELANNEEINNEEIVETPEDTQIVEEITPEGDPLYTILTAPKNKEATSENEEAEPLVLAIGETRKEAVENFNDAMLPFLEKTKVSVTDVTSTPLTNPNEGFAVVPELAEDANTNEAVTEFNNEYFETTNQNKTRKSIKKQRKKTELPISEIVIKRLPNGKLDVKRVNNRLDKYILKKQGYLTQEERSTLSQQPLKIEEVQKRLNKNRYEFKLDPDKSEYTITDKKTAVTQKISSDIILGVDTEKGKLVAANTSNLDDIDTNNFIAFSEDTISDYIDDDYNLVINKQQQDTNPPKLTTTENSIDGVPSLKQKLKKVWDTFETGDKIGLAAQTLPAVYNLTRGIFEKAKNYKAIYNPYAQSALNDMKQRRFNIDRTPSRLQVQAAQKQIQDNSVSNASRMANLANLAANAQKQEDALTVQEANVNQNQLPAENARFAYQIGEGIKQAEERQRNLNTQAKADKNNMLNAGITQLGNVGQHISNIENQRRADALAIKLANMRAPNYNYENGEINWTGYTKPRLNLNTNTPDQRSNAAIDNVIKRNLPNRIKRNLPNHTFEEKFEPIDFTKPPNIPNIPSLSKTELGGSYLNAYESPLPIKSNLEYKQGGYIDADTKLKELKKLKLRLKQLKKYK